MTAPTYALVWVTPAWLDRAAESAAAQVRQYGSAAELAEDFDANSPEYLAAMAMFGAKQQPIRANHVSLNAGIVGNHQTWGPPLPPAPNCRCYVAPRYSLPAGHALRFLSRWVDARAIAASRWPG